MQKIASFQVDHNLLTPGIYVSRVDFSDIVTYDLRFKTPNAGDYLDPAAAHTIEHLFATAVRSGPLGASTVYFGPMGCLTGNYLLMKGDLQPQDIVPLMQDTFRFVAGYEGEVPGAAPQDCGNYLLHDLPMAKWESAKYLHEVLEQMTEENMNYPEKAE